MVLDAKCEVKITSWEKLVQTQSNDDALFVGNVEFKVKSHSYKTDKLFIKNFYTRRDCIVEAKSARLLLTSQSSEWQKTVVYFSYLAKV